MVVSTKFSGFQRSLGTNQKVLHSAAIAKPKTLSQNLRNKISTTSAALLDARRLVAPKATYDETRRSLRLQLASNLGNDHQQRWIGKGRVVEKTAAIRSRRNFYRLFSNTGLRKPRVSKLIREFDCNLIHCHDRQLQHRAERFREQSSWPKAKVDLPFISARESVQVDTSPLFEIWVIKELGCLKFCKKAILAEMSPSSFNDGN